MVVLKVSEELKIKDKGVVYNFVLAAMWYSYKTGIFLLFGMLHMAASITGQFYFVGQIFLERGII